MTVSQVQIAHPGRTTERPAGLLPLDLELPGLTGLYGGARTRLALRSGLTTFVGPNGAGKSQVLRALRTKLSQRLRPRKTRFLAAGRMAPLESSRAAIINPQAPFSSNPTTVGSATYRQLRWDIEGVAGDWLALDARPDLRIKMEARLEALFGRRLRLQWTERGLQPQFGLITGESTQYYANVEASGLLQLIALLAAIYDDEVGALLIDEPEISLHPQLQAFLLQEIRQFAGDPATEPGKKLVVLSTHAPSMLDLRRIEQIPSLVFFSDHLTPPRQVAAGAGEMKSGKLRALVARLSESHKMAFFAQAVLLVEGPSDEIIINGLASRLDLPLAGGGGQVVPVTGEGEVPETVKLFRLMGKRPVVLADLNALVDNNALINIFNTDERAVAAATKQGHQNPIDLDRDVRADLARIVDAHWADIEPLAIGHAYLAGQPNDIGKARRRAVAATLLTVSEAELSELPRGTDWTGLRHRLEALLRVIEQADCFVLRRGTVEDYFLPPIARDERRKPDAAAAEAEAFLEEDGAALQERYDDVLRAIASAAAVQQVDENAYLGSMLASLLGAAFQRIRADTSDEALNTIAAGGRPELSSVFRLKNASTKETGTAIEVAVVSSLFPRDGFPFTIRFNENPNQVVREKLPSRP